MTNSYRGSLSQHVDLDEIGALENAYDMQMKEGQENQDNIIKHPSSSRYLKFSGEGSFKDTDTALAEEKDEDAESSGEEGELLDETDNIVYNQEIEKHVVGIVDIAKDKQTAEGDGLSIIETYNEQIFFDLW